MVLARRTLGRVQSSAQPPTALDTLARLVTMADPTPRRHLRVRTVDIGLACCAVEVAAAQALADAAAEMSADGGSVGASMTAGPVTPGSDPDALEVLVVAGTVTDAMAPLVRAEYDDLLARLGARLRVLSFGSCANTGGPTGIPTP